MAIPIVYNLRSMKVRWLTALAAVLGIAGTVGVFVAMLALAHGFQATLVNSGSPENVLIRRAGSSAELDGSVALDQVNALADEPGVAHNAAGKPLISPEAVMIAGFNLKESHTNANVQVRGVSPIVLEVRPNIKIIEGRFFTPGVAELLIGKNVTSTYEGLDLGSSVPLGGQTWKVVGVFDAGGSAFDSEVWADSRVLNGVYKRPENLSQSVTVRLSSVDAFNKFKDAVTADPKLTVQVDHEVEYYARQSKVLTTLITVLGGLVAVTMGIGAVIGALNTMYAMVSERGREIATMRALGFGGGAVVFSFLVEALLISFIGGVIGCLAVLPLNGLTTGAMNWQTFSHLAFAFRITPVLLLGGIIFALLMGLLGGLPPAMRAAWRPVAVALREL